MPRHSGGLVHHDGTRKKGSLVHSPKRKPVSAATKAKISAALKGRKRIRKSK